MPTKGRPKWSVCIWQHNWARELGQDAEHQLIPGRRHQYVFIRQNRVRFIILSNAKSPRKAHLCVPLNYGSPRVPATPAAFHIAGPDRLLLDRAVESPSVGNWMRFFFLVSSRIHSTGCFFRIRLWNGLQMKRLLAELRKKNVIQAALWFSNQLCSSGYSSKLMR